jgi:hypothetical protein
LKALVVVVAIAIAGCTSAPQSTATPTPIAPASPVATNSAESKAADFRIQLDLLLGEHVMIIAKQSSATARQAEYTSYLRLLTTNAADLTELVRSAIGDSLAARFGQIWNAQNDNLVTYTIGLASHDKAKSNQAMAGISGTFIPQLSQFLSDVTQIPTNVISPLLTRNMQEMRQMLDDELSRNYSRLYADIRSLYAHAIEVGDAVAPEVTGKFPDKFPGNATGPAANTRAALNVNWQEHSYLTTMRTSAIIGGRSSEQTAVAGALAQNANATDAVLTGLYGAPATIKFDGIWAAFNTATVGYASASTTTAKQRALGELTDTSVTQLSSWFADSLNVAADSSQPELAAQLEALVTVIDDQRTKSWSNLAGDDRAADTATEVVAELIAAPAIAKLPPSLR